MSGPTRRDLKIRKIVALVGNSGPKIVQRLLADVMRNLAYGKLVLPNASQQEKRRQKRFAELYHSFRAA